MNVASNSNNFLFAPEPSKILDNNITDSVLYLKTKREIFHTQIRKKNIDGILKSKRSIFSSNNHLPNKKIEQISENPSLILQYIKNLSETQTKEKFLEELILIKQYYSDKEIESLSELVENDFLVILRKILSDPIITKDLNIIRQIFWFICNITFLDWLQKIDYEFIVHFSLEYVNSPYEDISKMALWSLSNISEEGDDCRIKIIEAEALEIIYKSLNSKRQINLQFLENSLGLVNSLSKVEGSHYYEKFAPFIDIIVPCFHLNSESNILNSCGWILVYLTNTNEEKLNELYKKINSDLFIKILNSIWKEEAESARFALLRVICNFLSSNGEWIQMFMKNGIFDVFSEILKDKKSERFSDFQKEILWGFSNLIASENAENEIINKLITHEVFNFILSLSTSNDIKILKEIAFIYSNIIHCGSYEHIEFLIQNKLLLFFEDLLKSKETNSDIIIQILDDIYVMLESGQEVVDEESNGNNEEKKDSFEVKKDVISKKDNIFFISILNTDLPKVLITLQNHENEKVYEKVFKILEQHFDCELDDVK